jgi:hypothetical protein
VPLIAVAAPAAHAGLSQCTVRGSIQVGPNQAVPVRAICTAQAEWLHPGTLNATYATGSLPTYLEICNCQNADAYYRWRETDTLSYFEIEVDGVHVDQNSSAAGWRASFFLPGFGNTGGCKRFALTYRTAVARDTTAIPVSITFELQTGPTATGPWTTVTGTPITVSGTVAHVAGQTANFGTCSAGGTQVAPSGAAAAVPVSAPTGD